MAKVGALCTGALRRRWCLVCERYSLVNVAARLTCCLYGSLSRTELGRTCVALSKASPGAYRKLITQYESFLNRDDGAAARFSDGEQVDAITALLKAVMTIDSSHLSVSERSIRIILDRARTMLIHAVLPAMLVATS